MTRTQKISLKKLGAILLVMIIIATLPALAAEKKTSIAVSGGYMLGTGQWMEHRYIPSVNQFRPDLAAGVEFAHEIAQRVTLAIGAQYLNLNTGDWVDYVHSRGEDIRADANLYLFPISLRYHLIEREKGNLQAGVGLIFINSYSNETYQDLNYEYDFLNANHFGFLFTVQYVRFVSRTVAIGVGTGYIGSSLKYADYEFRPIMIFPLTALVRFYL